MVSKDKGKNDVRVAQFLLRFCREDNEISTCKGATMNRVFSMFRRHKLSVLIALWVMTVAFGLHALMVYKGIPGTAGPTPETWPENELIALPAKKPLLVMFAHPRCPCTKASLGELELLAAQAKDRFEAVVLFYQPANESEAWSKTASTDIARAIPGVRVVFDKEGDLAKRFGAETSGQTMVYAHNGKLLFSGGITGSRGHLGENQGFDMVLNLLRNESSLLPQKTTEVFGCGLFDQCSSRQTAEKN
jgi:hypothetical protein